MQQIDENAALADDPAMIEALEDNEAAILNEAAAVLSNSNEIPCTRCSYCMPCPFDVNIPGNFATYNEAVTFNNAERGKLRYAGMKEKGTAAAACQKCGACLEKCPQHIDIPGKLEKVVSILGK